MFGGQLEETGWTNCCLVLQKVLMEALHEVKDCDSRLVLAEVDAEAASLTSLPDYYPFLQDAYRKPLILGQPLCVRACVRACKMCPEHTPNVLLCKFLESGVDFMT